ncbi:hypothetical protein ACFE04_000687 [Oxalis oulophora]
MTTSIQITALDGIINVNSLFTLAVFLGLAWNPYDPSNTLIQDPSCFPSPSLAEALVSFHVYSFSSFLFSSLIALALKNALRISRSPCHYLHEATHNDFLHALCGRVNKSMLRVGMLVSGVGSVSGCVFLMLALINVTQIKLGTVACGSGHTIAAIVPLVMFVPTGLLIYVSIVVYAFTR